MDEIRKRKLPFIGDDGQQRYPSSTPLPEEIDKSDEICFGSIIDVKTQLCGSDGLSDFPIAPELEEQAFDLLREGDFFSLTNGQSKISLLDKKKSIDFSELTEAFEVRLQAFTSTSHILDIIYSSEEGTRGSPEKPLSVEINIYGSEKDAKEVGILLGKTQNFLQPPRYGLEKMIYKNPQILSIAGFSEETRIPPIFIYENDVDNSSHEDEQTVSQDDDVDNVDDFLDTGLRHESRTNISVDRRIQTELREHQKEAVDFISRRERGEMPEEQSLWKYNDEDEDEPFYQHVLNGERKSQPSHARGGILADEMGLGKTLVILSVIAGTLDLAKEFEGLDIEELQPQIDSQIQPQPKLNSQATLILVPSTLIIDNWVKEIRKHSFPSSLVFHKHIGQDRYLEKEFLRKRAIVFTTYATLATEVRREASFLSNINWFRIVLDEAHYIRNRATKQFLAVTKLSAQNRWCLTGTPIQNDIEDLGALIAFLKVPVLERPSTFRKLISHPISSNARYRFKNMQTLLHAVCIRRTRGLLEIPEPIIQVKQLPMSQLERSQYRELLHDCKMKIDMAVSGISRQQKARPNSTVLESLLALRLFCNNGKAVTNMPVDLDEAFSLLQQAGDDICAYCDRRVHGLSGSPEATGLDEAVIIPNCGHLVCQACLLDYLEKKDKCPACVLHSTSTNAQSKTLRQAAHQEAPTRQNSGTFSEFYPTKLRALLDDIIQNRSQRCIVFSSWRKTLSIISEMLSSHHIAFSMIDGSLPLPKRQQALAAYEGTNDTNVLLMTLGTGAVGLDLVSSSCIYLLEPQWNPSIEEQAIGRALRLGQVSQVRIVRYIMEGTVEESNVLSRQRKKRQLAGGGFKKRNQEDLELLKEHVNKETELDYHNADYDMIIDG